MTRPKPKGRASGVKPITAGAHMILRALAVEDKIFGRETLARSSWGTSLLRRGFVRKIKCPDVAHYAQAVRITAAGRKYLTLTEDSPRDQK